MRLRSFSNIPPESHKNWRFLNRFCFFIPYTLKKNQITVEAAVIFQHFPRITKQINQSKTIVPKNSFRIKNDVLAIFEAFLFIITYT
jgi:hypothetical protein